MKKVGICILLSLFSLSILYTRAGSQIVEEEVSAPASADTIIEAVEEISPLQKLNQEISNNKKNAFLRLERARLLASAEPKKAQKDLNAAIQYAPGNTDVFLEAAAISEDMGNFKGALGFLNKSLAFNDTTGSLYYQRGRVKEKNGEPVVSVIKDYLKAYTSPVAENEKAFNALSKLGEAGERDAVIAEIDSIKSGRPDLMSLEAGLYTSWGDKAKAETLFMEIINSGTATPETYLSLADFALADGNKPSEIAMLERGVSAFPGSVELEERLTNNYLKSGKFDDALSHAEHLQKLSPSNYKNYELQGQAFLAAGRHSEAVAPLLKALSLNDNPSTRVALEYAYVATGDSAGLASNSRALLDVKRTLGESSTDIPEFYQAMGYAGLSQPQEADSVLKIYYVTDPGTLPLASAGVFTLLGNKEKAVEAVEAGLNQGLWTRDDLLYSYYLQPLHSDKKYRALLEKWNLEVAYDEETDKLKPIFPEKMVTSGATPLADAEKISPATLQQWVDAINQLCPIDARGGGRLMSVATGNDGLKLIYNYEVLPEQMDLSKMNSNPAIASKGADLLATGLLSSMPDLASGEISIEWNYSYPDGSESFKQSVSGGKLAMLSASNLSRKDIDDMITDYWMALSKADFPAYDFYREGESLVIVSPAPEGTEEEDLSGEAEAMKTVYLSALTDAASNVYSIRYLRGLAKKGMGIRQKFRLDDEKTADGFVITPREILKITDNRF